MAANSDVAKAITFSSSRLAESCDKSRLRRSRPSRTTGPFTIDDTVARQHQCALFDRLRCMASACAQNITSGGNPTRHQIR
jgi:hypothetical protein